MRLWQLTQQWKNKSKAEISAGLCLLHGRRGSLRVGVPGMAAGRRGTPQLPTLAFCAREQTARPGMGPGRSRRDRQFVGTGAEQRRAEMLTLRGGSRELGGQLAPGAALSPKEGRSFGCFYRLLQGVLLRRNKTFVGGFCSVAHARLRFSGIIPPQTRPRHACTHTCAHCRNFLRKKKITGGKLLLFHI